MRPGCACTPISSASAAPADLVRWAAEAAGAPVSVGRRFSGGVAADVFAVRAGDRPLVLKVARREPGEPAAAPREAKCLQIARRGGLPVPDVVAFRDEALLMTRLPGRHRIRPLGDFRPFVRRLLELLQAIHAIDVARETLPAYAPYEPARVAELHPGPPPDGGPSVFLHRDFHQGNVLLSGERVTGIVDWQDGCLGSAWGDVAHLRANLFNFVSAEAADFAVDEFQRLNPALPPYHPYWDIATLTSLRWPRVRRLLETAVSKL